MNRRLMTLVVSSVLLLAAAAPAFADGIIITDPPVQWPCPQPMPPCPGCPEPLPCPPPLSNLAIKYHRVTVTIEDQVATTHVDQVFRNDQPYEVEGTYLFPLPEGAAVSDFAMWVDGQRVEAKILDHEQARAIYNSIVNQRRDPALLEYVGRGAVQASIFPIPPNGERRIELTYNQVLSLDNGLVRYVYGLDTERFSQRPLEQVSVSVTVKSRAAIKAVYSPSHPVTISRESDYAATAAYEATNVMPDRDFELDYSLSDADVGLSLLTYRDRTEDGFFLLLVAPKVDQKSMAVVDKDLLLVLDTSGSMEGLKLDQAKAALDYVLGHLNAGDRFNVITFSTGIRSYASGLRPAGEAAAAQAFVAGLRAEGGTDINRALLEAVAQADPARPTMLVFVTDGLPTVGEVDSDRILANLAAAAPNNVRLFAFGVGDDVDAVLLDSLAGEHRGTTGYVRPGEAIDEKISAFYAKVQTPLLADLKLEITGAGGDVYDLYPQPLPDLFAGTQLVAVGRYRASGAATAVLSGQVNGQAMSYTYGDLSFRDAGGDDFIPRLWATRRVGYLLAEIRQHGENRELIDEIVALSVRYGIITPYTSFLVTEDEILTEEGRAKAAEAYATAAPAAPSSGPGAVDQSQAQGGLQGAEQAYEPAPGTSGAQGVRAVGVKTFVLQNGEWTDTTFDPSKMTAQKLGFGSDAYFALAASDPAMAAYLAIGSHVIVVYGGAAYEVVEGAGDVQAPQGTPTPDTTPGRMPPGATPPAGGSPITCAPAAALALIGTAVVLRRRR